jgi:hypothetical protein
MIERLLVLRSQSWPAVAFAVAVGCLAAVLLTIPEILLPDANLGWVDAWYYVSFGFRLPEKLQNYWFMYQSERLAWTLPAYLANMIAPPLAAHYLFKTVFLVVSLVFFFGALRQTCSLKTSAFVTALAGLYSFFLHSLGANYVDGAATTFFLISIYTINRALRGDGSGFGNAFLSGASYFALLQAHMVFVLVLPLFAAYMLLVRLQSGRGSIRGFAAIACGLLSGGFAAYAAAVAAYKGWGVPSSPLRASLRMMFAHSTNSLILPNTLKWLFVAFWLVLPTAVVVWALFAVASSLRQGKATLFRLPAYYWFLIAMYGFWAALHLVKVPLMMLPFYVTALTPLTFLALGPLTMGMVDRLSSRAYASLLSLLFVVAMMSYRLTDPQYADSAILVAISCLAAATLLLVRTGATEHWKATAFVTLLIGALGGIDFATADYSTQIRNGYRYTEMANIYPEPRLGSRWTASRTEAFEGAIAVSERLRSRLYGRTFNVGYDGDEPMGMFFRSAGCLFFSWPQQRADSLNEHFRGIDQHTVDALDPQNGTPPIDLLVFSRDAQVPMSGARLALQWTEAFQTAGVPFYAHYFVVDVARPIPVLP